MPDDDERVDRLDDDFDAEQKVEKKKEDVQDGDEEEVPEADKDKEEPA